MTRARVQTEESDDEVSKVRVSQTAWFSDSSHPVMARVNARIEAVTGLSADMDKSNCELVLLPILTILYRQANLFVFNLSFKSPTTEWEAIMYPIMTI